MKENAMLKCVKCDTDFINQLRLKGNVIKKHHISIFLALKLSNNQEFHLKWNLGSTNKFMKMIKSDSAIISTTWKTFPEEELECMFKHETAPIFRDICNRKLCQFQHKVPEYKNEQCQEVQKFVLDVDLEKHK